MPRVRGDGWLGRLGLWAFLVFVVVAIVLPFLTSVTGVFR